MVGVGSHALMMRKIPFHLEEFFVDAVHDNVEHGGETFLKLVKEPQISLLYGRNAMKWAQWKQQCSTETCTTM